MHSPEPWKVELWCDGPVQIVDADGKPVVGFVSSFDGGNEPIICKAVDLKRIAACVNACRGIDTEALEGIEAEFSPTVREATLRLHQRTLKASASDADEARREG